MAKLSTIISALAVSTVAFVSPVHAAPAESFKAVCESQAEKSEKLQAACVTGDMPRVVKAGNRFDARGIGAELNVLVANLHLIQR